MPTGTATLDFGSTPTQTASVRVSGQTGLLSTSYVEAFLMDDATADHNSYEHTMVPMTLRCGNLAAGDHFDIIATCEWRPTGQFLVRWVWL